MAPLFARNRPAALVWLNRLRKFTCWFEFMTTVIAGREVKVGDPWFDDGNIILVTHDDPTAFLLHRGVLSRHSDMFKDMFEVGQPVKENEDAESSSQVVIMYDRPSDISSLVKVLYDGVTSNPDDPNDFFQLAGVLRLATKYCAQRIRAQAIRHLSTTWPHTLDAHDTFTNKALSQPPINNLSYPYVHPLHVLNLARETDADILVPSTAYFLSVYSLSGILAGDHPKLAVKHPSRPSSKLESSNDLQLYTTMYQHRLQLGQDFIKKFCAKFATGSRVGCSTSAECGRGFAKVTARAERSWNLKTSPIYFMLQIAREAISMDTICPSCKRGFAGEVEERRMKVWEELPDVVGLAPWSDLVSRDLE